MASDPLAGELVQIAKDKRNPAAVRIQAINSVLDRAGVSSRQTVDVEVQIGAKPDWFERIMADVAKPLDDFGLPFRREDVEAMDSLDWTDEQIAAAHALLELRERQQPALTATPTPEPADIDAELVDEARDRALRKVRKRVGDGGALPPTQKRRRT